MQVVISSPARSASWSRRSAASCASSVPQSRTVPWRNSVRPASARWTGSVPPAAGHMPCSSAGGPGRTSTVGPAVPSAAGTTRPGAVPTGSRTVAPAGTSACFRTPAAVDAASARHPRRAIQRSTTAPMRRSSAVSTADGRPWNAPTTSAVRSSAVGPRPPDVMTRSAPVSTRKASALRMSSGRSPTTTTCPTSTPRRRSCSASQGPFRSVTRPVSTSVPVTTMPARVVTGSDPRAAPAGAPARSVVAAPLPFGAEWSGLADPRSLQGGPVSSPSDPQPSVEPAGRTSTSTQEIPFVQPGPAQTLPPHPGAAAPSPVAMEEPQPTGPVDFVPGLPGTPPVPPTATAPPPPPLTVPEAPAGATERVWPDTLEAGDEPTAARSRRRVGAPRDRSVLVGAGLAVLSLVLLELGLALRFGTESYWSAVPLWSAFATLCAALALLAFAAASTAGG